MAHLLYRLEHGEMPETLHPKVWWLLIGTNDLGMGCSVDTIVAGNIRIVQEIHSRSTISLRKANDHHQQQSPTSIVINSILPRGSQELSLKESPWPTLQKVNQKLQCYAELNPHVHFVNVTQAFVAEMDDKKGLYVNEEMFEPDHVHPSPQGTKAWLELVVENVLELMA